MGLPANTVAGAGLFLEAPIRIRGSGGGNKIRRSSSKVVVVVTVVVVVRGERARAGATGSQTDRPAGATFIICRRRRQSGAIHSSLSLVSSSSSLSGESLLCSREHPNRGGNRFINVLQCQQKQYQRVATFSLQEEPTSHHLFDPEKFLWPTHTHTGLSLSFFLDDDVGYDDGHDDCRRRRRTSI